jgi:predicted DNA-binding WGR domain protein
MDMIYLKRRDAARNIARYYYLSVERNLFGEWSLMRAWGRIGRTGRMHTDLYDTHEAVQLALNVKLQEKRRKGYQ